MKIVINKCYGGFGLSDEAMIAYGKAKGFDVFPDRSGTFGSLAAIYWIVPQSERVKEIDWRSSSTEERHAYNKKYSEQTINDRGIKRDDADLIAVVESLGEKANGRFASLRVVEIPDDVSWDIDEYDGLESIHETHRSWD